MAGFEAPNDSPHYFSDLERAVRTCGLDWDPIKAARVFDESCIHHVPAVVPHRAQLLYDSLSGAAPAAPDATKNAVQLEADGRARDRLQADRLRQSRAYANEIAEALRLTRVRLDQETESLKLVERQLRLTEERLNQSVREADQVRVAYQELRLTEERLNQSVHEANQVRVAYQELRAYVDRLKAHPVLGLALTGRREVRNLVSRFKARRHA